MIKFFVEDGECYSFPWIAWEGLDAWWSKEGSIETQDENSSTYEKEISNLILENTDYAASLEKLQRQHPDFSWFSYFAVMFNSFTVSNSLSSELVTEAVRFYISILKVCDLKCREL